MAEVMADEAKVEQCVYCGCTPFAACATENGPCVWIDAKHTICSACVTQMTFGTSDNRGIIILPKLLDPAQQVGPHIVWKDYPPSAASLAELEYFWRHPKFLLEVEKAINAWKETKGDFRRYSIRSISVAEHIFDPVKGDE